MAKITTLVTKHSACNKNKDYWNYWEGQIIFPLPTGSVKFFSVESKNFTKAQTWNLYKEVKYLFDTDVEAFENRVSVSPRTQNWIP